MIPMIAGLWLYAACEEMADNVLAFWMDLYWRYEYERLMARLPPETGQS